MESVSFHVCILSSTNIECCLGRVSVWHRGSISCCGLSTQLGFDGCIFFLCVYDAKLFARRRLAVCFSGRERTTGQRWWTWIASLQSVRASA